MNTCENASNQLGLSYNGYVKLDAPSQETNSMTPLTQSFIKNSIKEYFTINYTKMSDADIQTLSENIYNHIITSRKNNKKFILKREQNN